MQQGALSCSPVNMEFLANSEKAALCEAAFSEFIFELLAIKLQYNKLV